MALGAGTILSTLLTIQLLPDKVSLRVGQIAPEDIVAHKYAQYEDTAETRRLRADIGGSASLHPPYAPEHTACWAVCSGGSFPTRPKGAPAEMHRTIAAAP